MSSSAGLRKSLRIALRGLLIIRWVTSPNLLRVRISRRLTFVLRLSVVSVLISRWSPGPITKVVRTVSICSWIFQPLRPGGLTSVCIFRSVYSAVLSGLSQYFLGRCRKKVPRPTGGFCSLRLSQVLRLRVLRLPAYRFLVPIRLRQGCLPVLSSGGNRVENLKKSRITMTGLQYSMRMRLWT